MASGFLAAGLPDGPPPAHTGGFGEPTCGACHTGGPDPGTPAVRGGIIMPQSFEPGRTYDIVVVAARDGLARAGFQLAARFAPHEPLAGSQAGLFVAADTARVRLARDSVREVWYASHARDGTRGPVGEMRWVVRWTAPAERQAVVFHAAVLAANDDDSNLGDEVQTFSLTSRPRRR